MELLPNIPLFRSIGNLTSCHSTFFQRPILMMVLSAHGNAATRQRGKTAPSQLAQREKSYGCRAKIANMAGTAHQTMCRTWCVCGAFTATMDSQTRSGGLHWKSHSPSKYSTSRAYRACSTSCYHRQGKVNRAAILTGGRPQY